MQTFGEVNERSSCSTFTTGNLRTLGEAAFTWFFRAHQRETAIVVREFSLLWPHFCWSPLPPAEPRKHSATVLSGMSTLCSFWPQLRSERALTTTLNNQR